MQWDLPRGAKFMLQRSACLNYSHDNEAGQCVAQDDFEGEIARMMAKSLYDAKTNVTPKFNARAISDFRFKTVRLFYPLQFFGRNCRNCN
jgi:hypothetical protein